MKGLFIGITSIDIIYPFEHFPEENAKNRSDQILIDIGGPASNAAYTFAALGGTATLASMVGQNPFREFIMSKFAQYGIAHFDLNDQLIRHPGVSSIIVNNSNGSRTVIEKEPRQNEEINAPILDPGNYDIICIDGYFGNYSLNVLRANKGNIPVVLDAGSFKSHTDELLLHTTYPILSANFSPPSDELVQDYLKSKSIDVFAITRGEQFILAHELGIDFEVPILPRKTIDTLGAGDIFHGAFTKYILESNFKVSLESASKVAGLSCQFLGTRKWSSEISGESIN